MSKILQATTYRFEEGMVIITATILLCFISTSITFTILSPIISRKFELSIRAINAPSLVTPSPTPNSIGNFFQNYEDERMSFIQCYIYEVGNIDGTQYGIGFPMDMPVMLTYFEKNGVTNKLELIPVLPDYPDYEHLLDNIANQLDSYEFQLYRTPIVLTLQGEFEDEEFNSFYGSRNSNKSETAMDDDDDEDEQEEKGLQYVDDDDDEIAEEISLEDLMKLEGISLDTQDYDADDIDEDEDDNEEEEENEAIQNDDDDEEEDLTSFWRSSPAGRLDAKYDELPDYSIIRGNNENETATIPSDALVTEEDTKNLQRAHKRADQIIQYANDMKLIASFHYKKKNFHLVRLLEPIFIIGKRIDNIKGYYFTLLSDAETMKVRPILEKLLAEKNQKALRDKKLLLKMEKNGPVDDMPTTVTGRNVKEKGTTPPGTGSGEKVFGNRMKSRRRWTNKKSN